MEDLGVLYKQRLIAIILSKGIISSSPVDKLTHEELRGLAQGHTREPVTKTRLQAAGASGGAMPCLPCPAPAA